MQFKLRTPFSIHLEQVKVVDQGGRKVRQPSVTSYYADDLAGTIVNLSEADAVKHLHKLEPMDEQARALMKARYDANQEVRNARAVSEPGTAANASTAADDQRVARLEAKVERLTKLLERYVDEEDAEELSTAGAAGAGSNAPAGKPPTGKGSGK